MTDERLAIICGLPLGEFVAALLEDDPHLSAKDIAALAKTAGKPCSKGLASTLRKQWKSFHPSDGPDVEDEVTGEAPTVELAQQRAFDAATARDSAAFERWIRAWAKLKDLVPATGAGEGDVFDWARLSEADRACMQYLTAKAHGAPLDEDALWFASLLARVPPRPERIHPAHVPLPEAERPANFKV